MTPPSLSDSLLCEEAVSRPGSSGKGNMSQEAVPIRMVCRQVYRVFPSLFDIRGPIPIQAVVVFGFIGKQTSQATGRFIGSLCFSSLLWAPA